MCLLAPSLHAIQQADVCGLEWKTHQCRFSVDNDAIKLRQVSGVADLHDLLRGLWKLIPSGVAT